MQHHDYIPKTFGNFTYCWGILHHGTMVNSNLEQYLYEKLDEMQEENQGSQDHICSDTRFCRTCKKNNNMKKRLFLIALPMLLLASCTTKSEVETNDECVSVRTVGNY